MTEDFLSYIRKILAIDSSEITPLSSEEERRLYALGYEHYEREEYRQAAQIFTQLVLSEPFTHEYWRALASSKQMTKAYEAALHAWSLAALLQEGDPIPHFHAAECLIHMGETTDALKAIDAALSLCHETDPLYERIDLLRRNHAACA
ncbi:MAG: SycD/LcrH family type III secretion system chaperone [Verrucomicrobia bacterium]|nr:SycD/LcrH family type III secretion system chaperone [Verrucomicrobiota bacterium]